MPDLPDYHDAAANGQWIYDRIVDLYPLCRSITGDGVRQTLHALKEYIPLEIVEIPSGTPVFDWQVPKEWNIRDAWIKSPDGQRVVDFKQSNLHVVSYSRPVHQTMPLEELRPHLHTLPDHPDWIPYRTSYYRETWGFCLMHNQLQALKEANYEVCIDATLKDGHLTYGEVVLRGEREDEFLISAHVCHPSLCNDNLSGVCTAAALAAWIGAYPRRFTYRFVFAPGTIGAITWLAMNQSRAEKIKHGLILSGIGDAGALSYKRTRQGQAEIDRAVDHVLRHCGRPSRLEDFSPYGYDERQYGSPGFNLPVGRLSRTPFGTYPQYHTSADNLEFVQPTYLSDSFEMLTRIIDVIENQATFINQNPFCEPQLGKRGLYNAPGSDEMALLWVLNLSDGAHSLIDIAERASLPFVDIANAAQTLEKNALLIRVDD